MALSSKFGPGRLGASDLPYQVLIRGASIFCLPSTPSIFWEQLPPL